MKIDAEFLKKYLFWILLGGALFLTFLGWICLSTHVAGLVAKKKLDNYDQPLKNAKQQNVKSPEWIRLHEIRAQLHDSLKTTVWKKAWETQKPEFTWPTRFEQEYRFKDGLFAKNIVATRSTKGIEPGGNAIGNPQNAPGGGVNQGDDAKQPEKEKVIDTVKGSIFAIDDEVVRVKTIVKGKETILPIYRTNEVKVSLTDDGKQVPQATFNSLLENDRVEVTFQRGKYFGDELTREQWKKYKDTYQDQIDGILQIVQPWTPDGGIVQFRGWRYEKDRLPPDGSSFFHCVARDWQENPAWSKDVWTAQEELWIQRELFRLIRKANDHAAELQCKGGTGANPLYFESDDWKLTLQLTKDKKLKVALTNRSDYILQLGKVNLTVQVNGANLAAGNTVLASFVHEGEVEPGKTVAPKSGPLALSPRNVKIDGLFAAGMEVEEVKQAKKDDAEAQPIGGVQGRPQNFAAGQPNSQEQEITRKKQVVTFSCKGGPRHKDSVFFFANTKWELKLHITEDRRKLAVQIENLTPFPRRLDADFKIMVNNDADLDDDERYVTIRAQHAMVPPKNELTASSGKNKVFPKGTPFALPSGLIATGIYGVQQVLTWKTAAVKRIDYVSIGSGKSSGGGGGVGGQGEGRAPAAAAVGGQEAGGAGSGGSGGTAHSHKTVPKGLVAFFKDAKAANNSEGGDPQMPGGDPAGGGAPAGEGALRGGFGGPQGGGNAGGNRSKNGFDFKRYVEVTKESRRIPVALALIIDQDRVGQVLAAFTNSKMRFLTTQVLINRYPQSIRPPMVGGGSEKPGGGATLPGGRIPPGGAPAAANPLGTAGGEENQPTGPDDASGEDRITNIELVIYGFVTIYRRFPPQNGTTNAE